MLNQKGDRVPELSEVGWDDVVCVTQNQVSSPVGDEEIGRAHV